MNHDSRLMTHDSSVPFAKNISPRRIRIVLDVAPATQKNQTAYPGTKGFGLAPTAQKPRAPKVLEQTRYSPLPTDVRALQRPYRHTRTESTRPPILPRRTIRPLPFVMRRERPGDQPLTHAKTNHY